jgi:hypothetical protein
VCNGRLETIWPSESSEKTLELTCVDLEEVASFLVVLFPHSLIAQYDTTPSRSVQKRDELFSSLVVSGGYTQHSWILSIGRPQLRLVNILPYTTDKPDQIK